MLPWLASETVTPVTPATIPSYGDATELDWSDTTPGDPITGCHVEPSQTTESLALQREALTLEVLAYLPSADPALNALHGFEWRGMTFKVVGDVMPWYDTTGSGLDHSVVKGRKVRG